MKVLAANRQVFTLLWILPVSKDESKWIKLRNFSIGSIIFMALLGALISSGCFALKFATINLELSLYAVFQIAATLSQTYMLGFSFILWRKYADFFPKLQQMYDESKLNLI